MKTPSLPKPTLFLRGGVLWMNVTIRGQRYRESLNTSDPVEAAIEANRRVQIYATKAPEITWERLTRRWFTDKAGKKSINRDRDFEAYFTTFFSGRDIASITKEEVLDALARKRDETSPGNANKYRAWICSLWNMARAMGWEVQDMSIQPYDNPNEKRLRFLEREQLSRLLQELPEHLRAMFEFSVLTGLRKSNVCGLRWDQVVDDVVVLEASTMKGQSLAVIPLPPRALEIIEAQKGKHQTYVFTFTHHSGKFPPRPVKDPNNTAWKKALKRAGIRDFRWHDGRHTFGAYHSMNGTPTHVLQQLGAWKNPEMAARYAALNVKGLRKFSDKMVTTGGKD
ncbi:MAG: tyrosine-type recombinase/integrase [Leucobacter sp.]